MIKTDNNIEVQGKHRIIRTARDFEEWSWGYGDCLMFVNIYADDSGTHAGAPVQTLSGLIARTSTWANFTPEWSNAIKKLKFEGPYFHYTEWRFAQKCLLSGNPPKRFQDSHYSGWKLNELTDFGLALAKIVGRGGLYPVCGGVNVPISSDPHKDALICFFDSVRTELDRHLSNLNQPESVTVFFDQNSDPVWLAKIHATFNDAKVKDKRLKTYGFATMLSDLPMQAADMLAGKCREIGERGLKDGYFLHLARNGDCFERALFRSVIRSAKKENKTKR
jgi:hypothetical protein